MRKYLNKNFLSVTLSLLVFSIVGYFVILFWVDKSASVNEITVYPVSDWYKFLFFSKYLGMLVLFVFSFTILGSYLIAKYWAKEVTIKTIIHEVNGNLERVTKVTFFSEEERQLFKIMVETEGHIYQNDLATKSGLPRYTISRIITKFENYGVIEKERHGMTNLIRLKISNTTFD